MAITGRIGMWTKKEILMETLFPLFAALITLIALARGDGAVHVRRPDDGTGSG